MNKNEMLKKIQLDRPTQVIHKVLSFKENEYGFYNVTVDMENIFFSTRISHVKCTLPYPIKKYENLSENDQTKWRESYFIFE